MPSQASPDRISSAGPLPDYLSSGPLQRPALPMDFSSLPSRCAAGPHLFCRPLSDQRLMLLLMSPRRLASFRRPSAGLQVGQFWPNVHPSCAWPLFSAARLNSIKSAILDLCAQGIPRRLGQHFPPPHQNCNAYVRARARRRKCTLKHKMHQTKKSDKTGLIHILVKDFKA